MLMNTSEKNIKPISKWGGYSKITVLAWMAMTVYLTLPLVDVPLIGLSLSAPLALIAALQPFLKPPLPWLGRYWRWIGIAGLIWLGIFAAVAVNSFISGGVILETSVVTSLIQYAFWLIVFILTCHLISSAKLGRRTAAVSAVGIVILGLLRLAEAVIGGAIGAWMNLDLLTQNMYGIHFSTFSAVVLAYAFTGKKPMRGVVGTMIVWAAIFINGSRSSWIASSISMVVFLLLYSLSVRKIGRGIVVAGVLLMLAWLGLEFAPDNVRTAFNERLGTFENLNQDKSFVVREMMIQKGLTLFEEDPLFGVGTSRWTKESVIYEVPAIFQYADISDFDRKSSHNSYIGFLAENGLVGMIPLAILILVLVVRGGLTAVHMARRGETWVLGFYAGFIGMSIHLWSLSGLTGTVTWFVYGLVAGIVEQERQHHADMSLMKSNLSR